MKINVEHIPTRGLEELANLLELRSTKVTVIDNIKRTAVVMCEVRRFSWIPF